jgi:hypothetical protein
VEKEIGGHSLAEVILAWNLKPCAQPVSRTDEKRKFECP